VDPRKYVLDSGPNPPTGRSNFGGHPAHRKTLRVTAAYINAAVYAAKKINNAISATAAADYTATDWPGSH